MLFSWSQKTQSLKRRGLSFKLCSLSRKDPPLWAPCEVVPTSSQVPSALLQTLQMPVVVYRGEGCSLQQVHWQNGRIRPRYNIFTLLLMIHSKKEGKQYKLS